MNLEEIICQIQETDKRAGEIARKRWNSIAKPLHSLGLLEEITVQMASVKRTADIRPGKKALVVMCGDNGIVEEGVTQTGQEVTAVVTENFTKGDTCSCIMAELAGADVFPIDIGVAKSLDNCGSKYPLISRNIARGTKNFLKEPAMTKEETVKAITVGFEIVKDLKNKGYEVIATGEMGIGNTTTSSAVASLLLDKDPRLLTGKGAGLSKEGLERKIQVIAQGIAGRKPDKNNVLDVLSKVGGLDIAGLLGVYLGGAAFLIPVIVDGLISATAALCAVKLCPAVKEYIIASHLSEEPAGKMLLEALGLEPAIQAKMCLGEGSGALALLPLLDMGLAVYNRMSTFEEIKIQEYKEFS